MLIRMVKSIQCWDGSQKMGRKDALFSGDSVTDLHTSQNTLSVWLINDISEIDDVLIAFALKRSDIAKLCYVVLDESDIKDMDINFECRPEEGYVEGFQDDSVFNKHYDLIDIDFWRLGFLTEYIFERVGKNERDTLSTSDIRTLFKRYINTGKIKMDDVNEKLKSKLQKL